MKFRYQTSKLNQHSQPSHCIASVTFARAAAKNGAGIDRGGDTSAYSTKPRQTLQSLNKTSQSFAILDQALKSQTRVANNINQHYLAYHIQYLLSTRHISIKKVLLLKQRYTIGPKTYTIDASDIKYAMYGY